jgi:hypothetical protein
VEGIDFTEHGEAAYDLTNRGGGVLAKQGVPATVAAPTPTPAAKEGASA